MATYATKEDFEAYVEGWITSDADALERTLKRAEEDIDLIVGPINPDPATGRKFVIGELEATDVVALNRAVCAQAEFRIEMGEAYFVRPQFDETQGPDFSTKGRAPMIGPKAMRELTYSSLLRLTTRTDRRGAEDLPPWHDSNVF